ncbi:beta-propeller domain-containing protein [Psychrosphaera aquimarina]|uniref:Beta-propeller domain-containing protein n=1 Tax=Psychrosphaera aquimarina TaxID=2044854 RepID=A0ABU3R485_9GAMM|nr:beta-propeller domain-containing protein [Psychrosphaera aquimarina]MDU0114490.1 beta-propeller domain-containing protein [Psychrosphaera aquimarina]
MKIKILVSLLVATLVACNNNHVLNHNDLKEMELDGNKLVKSDVNKTELVIKNGVFLSSTRSYTQYFCNECEEPVAVAESVSADNSATRFSGTTTQETGVAESDRVKYNGKTMYLASNRDIYSGGGDQAPHIRVLDKQSDDSLLEVAIIPTDKNANYLSDLYLNDQRMMAIYSKNKVDDLTTAGGNSVVGIAAESYWYQPQAFGVNINDVTDHATPTELVNYSIDGHVLSSRRIGNKVYIVSAYQPELSTYSRDLSSDYEMQSLYQDVLDTDISDLLPTITKKGSSAESLVDIDQCYVPDSTLDETGFNKITTLTTFDLNDPETFNSICVIAPLDGLYASPNNLYLYGRIFEQENNQYKTVIHQFALNDDKISYAASGSVLGHLAWNNSHLRFSERDEFLRVVTSDNNVLNDNNDRVHRLFVLKSNEQQQLETVATLPNDENPAPIGKPNEDIYAVRYFADKAYVVTFRRTDPLFVIDLSEPTHPVIAGELEIPGYSGYLQPLNDNFILGIGQQIDPNTNGLVNATEQEFTEGAKAELYDVSNPNNPIVAATLVYENRSSVAEWDYHALTQLKVDDTNFKFSFPLSGWQRSIASNGDLNWQYFQSMQMVEVSLDNGGVLNNVGNLTTDSNYYGSWGDRSVIHSDVFYYIRDNLVWQTYWSNPTNMTGPY